LRGSVARDRGNPGDKKGSALPNNTVITGSPRFARDDTVAFGSVKTNYLECPPPQARNTPGGVKKQPPGAVFFYRTVINLTKRSIVIPDLIGSKKIF